MTKNIKTKLHFHPDWKLSMPEKYVYQFEHQKLPNLKENQISISGIKLEEYDGNLVATAFIRSTVSKPIKLEHVQLLLLNHENKPFAKKTFDLESFGELPPNSAQPWRFLFSMEDRLTDDAVPFNDWKIAFELKEKTQETHMLDLDESWEKSLASEQKEHLEKLVSNLPPLKANEVNFMGLQAKITEKNDLHVTLLIRNGSEKEIVIEQLPLTVEDADGKITAKGSFKLEDFKVKANTSKPWTFIFPESLLLDKNPNLSKWKAYAPS